MNELARRFYLALNNAPFTNEHGNLTGFPDECCHHASIMFAIYLLDTLELESTTVFAKRSLPRERRHVWVECDGTVIDLTCIQFRDEGMPDFLVSSNSAWHDSWERVERDTSVMDAERSFRLLSDWYQGPYDLVMSQLDAIQ